MAGWPSLTFPRGVARRVCTGKEVALRDEAHS